jgi:hypothetical protein
MGDFDPSASAHGLTIEAVDWLPSGGRSGLVRVRGRRPEGDTALPELVVEHGGEVHRHKSLPDPRAGREPGAWRGAYVVQADAVQGPDARLFLEFSGGARIALPRPADTAAEPPPAAGDDVVDRTGLADRRARRAEAAEQAQARIAREALKAVEVLELRAAQLEERLQAATAERDAYAARSAGSAGPAQEAETLRRQLREAEARVAQLEAEPPPVPAVPGSVEDAVRRADRLRDALTTAIGTVGELRLQLHQARVRSRTTEIAHAADAVRLTVLASERASVRAELDTLRRAVKDAQATTTAQAVELEAAHARIAGAEAAHNETRRRFTERVAELGEARERIAALESDLAGTRAEARQAMQDTLGGHERELEEARREAERTLAARDAEAKAALDAARVELERVEASAREQVARAEAALAGAETARELAEAAAVAAQMQARVSDVARAAGVEAVPDRITRERFEGQALELAAAQAEIETLRAQRTAQAREIAERARELEAERDRRRALEEELEAERSRPRPVAVPPPAPPQLPVQAAEQEEAAAAAEPQPQPMRLVADLEAAAEALRARAPEPEPEPEPQPEQLEPAPFADPSPPVTIVSPADPPRTSVATGRGARDYPALRGALVKLAHDDAQAAARLLVGLLPAQWKVIDEPVDYDVTLAEAGTYAVTVTAGAASVRPLTGDRGRSEAEFHLRTDALTLAEMLAGHGPRPRRFGRARVSGRTRRVRVLQPLHESGLSLAEAVRAGARLEPELVLRTLAYAVHPSWTAGHEFTIAHTFTGPEGDETLYITARDGRGLSVAQDPPPEIPNATVVLTRTAFEALLRGDSPPPGERPTTRGDHRAAATLRAWADRARGAT